jgi:hypothetical protein
MKSWRAEIHRSRVMKRGKKLGKSVGNMQALHKPLIHFPSPSPHPLFHEVSLEFNLEKILHSYYSLQRKRDEGGRVFTLLKNSE